MELKEFLKTAINEAVTAVEESSSVLGRDIYITSRQDNNSIEFDLAVTSETLSGGKASINVCDVLKGAAGKELKRSDVSRVTLAVYVPRETNLQRNNRRQRDGLI